MDKIVLNEDQIALLKAFIEKKGFKEPIVVNEILDHFACKTEELLAQYPLLPFDDVMKKAHASFGVAGFRPIVQAFEEGLRKKYNQLFWKKFLSVLFSLQWTPLIIITGWATYYLATWAQQHQVGFLHHNIVADIELAGTIGLWLVYIKTSGGWKAYRSNYFMFFVQQPFQVGYFIIFMPSQVHNAAHIWILAGLYSLLISYTLVYGIASFSVQQIAIKERRSLEIFSK